MTLYRKQTAKVKWEGYESEEFSIKNGVRQGAVISPLFFSFYLDDMFGLLKASGSGCYIGDYYAGCFGYADDLFFLCPSRKGLQEMLNIAEKYMSDHNITFSTNEDPVKSKTKGIIFTRQPLKTDVVALRLNGNSLPWVTKAKYLGNDIEAYGKGLYSDVRVKRAKYIERNVEINQEFPFAHPGVKCKLNQIYNSSFPGSTLYDLFSLPVTQLINSWSVSVRQMWGLPVNSHKYLVEPLGGTHAYSMIISRFVSFLQNARKSPKLGVQLMLQKVVRNASTTTGRNICLIENIIGGRKNIMELTPKWIKKNISFSSILEHEEWRVNLIKEIVDLKHNILMLLSPDDCLMTTEELDAIVIFASTT